MKPAPTKVVKVIKVGVNIPDNPEPYPRLEGDMKNFYFFKDSNFTIVISKEINALPIIDTQLSHNKPCIFGERIEPSSKVNLTRIRAAALSDSMIGLFGV